MDDKTTAADKSPHSAQNTFFDVALTHTITKASDASLEIAT